MKKKLLSSRFFESNGGSDLEVRAQAFHAAAPVCYKAANHRRASVFKSLLCIHGSAHVKWKTQTFGNVNIEETSHQDDDESAESEDEKIIPEDRSRYQAWHPSTIMMAATMEHCRQGTPVCGPIELL